MGTRSRAGPEPRCTHWAPVSAHADDCLRIAAVAGGAAAAAVVAAAAAVSNTRYGPLPTSASSATGPRAART